ncbi:MAG: IS1595 family transposase [Candidatus Angelobacter sp.]
MRKAPVFSVRDFFKRFPDDDSCLAHVMQIRHGGTERECPNCHKPAKFYRLKKRPAYSCALCGFHIYPCAGTPFERTRTPLQLWFYAMYLFTTSRHGVPAKELQRQLSVTYKTAWRMAHEIRKHMANVDGDANLSGEVEIDETFVGGMAHRPSERQVGHVTENSKKTIVFGMVERGGDLITRVVPNTKKSTLFPIIEEKIEKGTLLSTDEMSAYKFVGRLGYEHGTVNHSEEEWVNGKFHTNTIEGFWSHFKCSVKGVHRSISRKHMQKYLCEFEFRFNLRGALAYQMFDRLILAF